MDKGFSKNDMLGKCHSLNGDGSNPPVTKKKTQKLELPKVEILLFCPMA